MLNPLIGKLAQRDALDDVERDVLERIPSRVRHYAPGEHLVRQGERPGHSALLIGGWAGRIKAIAGGRRTITALHLRGDFVDLHSLLLRPMDHDVEALTACEVAEVPHERLRALTEEHPHLARLLWLDTLVDAAIHREWAAGLAARQVAGRLAHLVCELFLRAQAAGLTEDDSFTLPLSQNTVGEVIGAGLVHVNRTLQSIRREGLLKWRRGRVEILDWERLAQLGGFEPAYLNLTREPR